MWRSTMLTTVFITVFMILKPEFVLTSSITPSQGARDGGWRSYLNYVLHKTNMILNSTEQPPYINLRLKSLMPTSLPSLAESAFEEMKERTLQKMKDHLGDATLPPGRIKSIEPDLLTDYVEHYDYKTRPRTYGRDKDVDDFGDYGYMKTASSEILNDNSIVSLYSARFLRNRFPKRYDSVPYLKEVLEIERRRRRLRYPPGHLVRIFNPRPNTTVHPLTKELPKRFRLRAKTRRPRRTQMPNFNDPFKVLRFVVSPYGIVFAAPSPTTKLPRTRRPTRRVFIPYTDTDTGPIFELSKPEQMKVHKKFSKEIKRHLDLISKNESIPTMAPNVQKEMFDKMFQIFDPNLIRRFVHPNAGSRSRFRNRRAPSWQRNHDERHPKILKVRVAFPRRPGSIPRIVEIVPVRGSRGVFPRGSRGNIPLSSRPPSSTPGHTR